MEDALIALSRNLPGAFRETIDRIQRLPESRRKLGMNTLMWICHARRPLTVSELSEALSIRAGQTNPSRKHCPSPSIIIECCQGLAVLDPESINIRLAHYSVQEYLVSHREDLFPQAESDIASACLVYLLFEPFRKGPRLQKFEIEMLIAGNPFLSYASRYWGTHVGRSETDPQVQQLVFALFTSGGALAQSNQVIEIQKGRRREYWTVEECYSGTYLSIPSLAH
jgi:hypothetical protein